MKKLLYLVCILSLAVILSAPLTTMAKKPDEKQYHVEIVGDISGEFTAKNARAWECALTCNVEIGECTHAHVHVRGSKLGEEKGTALVWQRGKTFKFTFFRVEIVGEEDEVMYKLETGGEPVKGTGGTTIIKFDGAPAHIMHFGCVSTPDGPWCGWLPDWDGTLTFTITITPL